MLTSIHHRCTGWQSQPRGARSYPGARDPEVPPPDTQKLFSSTGRNPEVCRVSHPGPCSESDCRYYLSSLAGAIILKVSHGYEVNLDGKDPIVSLIEQTMEEFAHMTTPGSYLVDVLPARASSRLSAFQNLN
jgi:hypothetical protein